MGKQTRATARAPAYVGVFRVGLLVPRRLPALATTRTTAAPADLGLPAAAAAALRRPCAPPLGARLARRHLDAELPLHSNQAAQPLLVRRGHRELLADGTGLLAAAHRAHHQPDPPPCQRGVVRDPSLLYAPDLLDDPVSVADGCVARCVAASAPPTPAAPPPRGTVGRGASPRLARIPQPLCKAPAAPPINATCTWDRVQGARRSME